MNHVPAGVWCRCRIAKNQAVSSWFYIKFTWNVQIPAVNVTNISFFLPHFEWKARFFSQILVGGFFSLFSITKESVMGGSPARFLPVETLCSHWIVFYIQCLFAFPFDTHQHHRRTMKSHIAINLIRSDLSLWYPTIIIITRSWNRVYRGRERERDMRIFQMRFHSVDVHLARYNVSMLKCAPTLFDIHILMV